MAPDRSSACRAHPHPLAERALALPLPDGPVLDLASGPSGSVLLAAAAERRCVARAWQLRAGALHRLLGPCTDRRRRRSRAARRAARLGGAHRPRKALQASWCLGPGEPASLLRDDFGVLAQEDLPGAAAGSRRRLLARRGWFARW